MFLLPDCKIMAKTLAPDCSKNPFLKKKIAAESGKQLPLKNKMYG